MCIDILSRLKFSMAPAARMSMTRRVFPLVSLNPYQGSWTIKVRVTSKGNMRTYKNARGEGCVFNVELTDEEVRHQNRRHFYISFSTKSQKVFRISFLVNMIFWFLCFRAHRYKQQCSMKLQRNSLTGFN